MSIERLVCGQIRGCTLGDTAHIITSVRNPVEVISQEAFWNSYINITKEVREKLGNPSCTISIENINYRYFTEI